MRKILVYLPIAMIMLIGSVSAAIVDAMSTVPEPSTLLLLGAGLAGLGVIIMIMRRKQRK